VRTGGTLEEIDAILERGGDVDDVLRSVVAALVDPGGCAWAGILFSEDGELVLGPEAGAPGAEGAERTRIPVLYGGARVAELVADDCDDPALLESVARRISELCLVGWDTGGVPWPEEAG
jgi:hypothetical protein